MEQKLHKSSGIMQSLGESSFGRGVAAVAATLSLLSVSACAKKSAPEEILEQAVNRSESDSALWSSGVQESYAKLSLEQRHEFILNKVLPQVTSDLGSGVIEIKFPVDYELAQVVSLGELLAAYKEAHKADLRVTSVAALSTIVGHSNPSNMLLLTAEPLNDNRVPSK